MSKYVLIHGTDKVLETHVVSEDDVTFCDDCGEPCLTDFMAHYEHLPLEVDSANAGESGSLCDSCDAEMKATVAVMDYAKHYTNLALDNDTPFL